MTIYIFLVVLTIIVCVFLSLIVLVQNPKGGGLDSNFGGMSSNTFGAQRTTDFLEKGTWYLAIALLAISLASAIVIRNVKGQGVSSGLEKYQPSSTAPVANPQENVGETESIIPQPAETQTTTTEENE